MLILLGERRKHEQVTKKQNTQRKCMELREFCTVLSVIRRRQLCVKSKW